MKHEHRPVIYCYECGDESLPHLKDLVSDKEDPMKSKILAYLRTNCILACPGILEDQITPKKYSGSGNLYYDGTYFWDDAFFYYVDRYNIPVPAEFRNHILENFNTRMKRHALFNQITRVRVETSHDDIYSYVVDIYKNGVIRYEDLLNHHNSETFTIKPEDAYYIINPIMKDLFCYDADDHGQKSDKGYHWKLTFFKYKDVADTIEGWPDEDIWRYRRLRNILKFAERFIPKDLGTKYMNYYNEELD